MSSRKLSICLGTVSLAAFGFCAFVNSALPAENGTTNQVELLDLKDHRVNPFSQTNAKAIVFIFVTSSCPIANRYAPEIQRLQNRFKDVAFWLVHADPKETTEEIEKHQREYGYTCGVLRDPRHQLVALAGARVTPEAALFLPNGQLAYHGRIDDRYEDFGKARSEPTRRDLQLAIEAVLKGKSPPVRETRAVGCYIPGLK